MVKNRSRTPILSFISIQSPLVIKPLSEKITHSGKCELPINEIIHASLQAPLVDTIRNASAIVQDAPIAGAWPRAMPVFKGSSLHLNINELNNFPDEVRQLQGAA